MNKIIQINEFQRDYHNDFISFTEQEIYKKSIFQLVLRIFRI